MRFEDKVDVIAKVYPLSVGQGQQVIVVQDGVERLYPFRIDVAIAH